MINNLYNEIINERYINEIIYWGITREYMKTKLNDKGASWWGDYIMRRLCY